MKKIIIYRLLQLAPTLLVISILTFSIMHFAPGNPAEILMKYRNPEGGIDPAALRHYEHMLGLDQPFLTQVLNWLSGVLRGDFGDSFYTGESVLAEFGGRISYTLGLIASGTVFSLILGVFLGFLSAHFRDSWLDHLLRLTQSIKMSVPNFWIALLFILIFSTKLHWFNAIGCNSVKDLILPGIVLGLGNSSRLMRLVRTSVLEERSSGYAYTYRVNGLSEFSIFVRHILKNILLPVATLTSTSIISMIGSSVIVERIFSFPGIGSYLIQAIGMKDYPVAIGFLFMYACMVVIINLAVDILYLIIDPRVRDVVNVSH
jgi:peptide/nickel transport system permease protein